MKVSSRMTGHKVKGEANKCVWADGSDNTDSRPAGRRLRTEGSRGSGGKGESKNGALLNQTARELGEGRRFRVEGAWVCKGGL